jgi:exodeoxyribonuclease-3
MPTPSRLRPLTIASWNVNGLRAAASKGFLAWLAVTRAEVVGVQEVRAPVAALPDHVRAPTGWHASFVAAERKGYSGVGLYARTAPDELRDRIDHRGFDAEGRVLLARFGKLLVVNAYFPNGKGKQRDNSRVPFKLRFYKHLFALLKDGLSRGEPMLVMGDFNTAHQEIDLARPKQNQKISGFLPQERRELSRWLDAGWIDTFRRFQPGPGHFSWWSQRQGVRERNIGWRIDYVLASPGAERYLLDAAIERHVLGSDHCPVSVTLDRRVLGA